MLKPGYFLSFPYIQAHFVFNPVFLAGLQNAFQRPILVLVEIGEIRIGLRAAVNLRHIGSFAVRQQLTVDTPAADNEGTLRFLRRFHCLLSRVTDDKALKGIERSGQRNVQPAGQGLSPWEIVNGASARNHRRTFGRLAEKSAVGTQRNRLGTTDTNAPVIINSNN